MCNWSPHVAFQRLQDSGSEIPAEIKMVRVPCTGRVTKSLLFKAFEKGADGVALVGCRPGTCRYGSGTMIARHNTTDMQDIIETVGLNHKRMRYATFEPDDEEGLLAFLKDFNAVIHDLGHSPIRSSGKTSPVVISREMIAEMVRTHDVFACQDCGKCTSACSLALSGKPFSPRIVAESVIGGDLDSSAVRENIWSCLTCGICYDRCPSAVNFPEFIRDIRHLYRLSDRGTHESHGGFFHSLMRAMSASGLETKRWKHIPEGIRVDPDSKRLFFGGCAPYFDLFFRNHLGVDTQSILWDSLRLLNFFDIQPAVLHDERCCGHDLLWSGDRENFLKLARLNMETIHRHGFEEIVTACPECYRTLVHDYPAYGIELDCKVTHLYDLLEAEIDKGAVEFKKLDKHLTFQDPCRLSRFEQRPELPRKLLNRLNSAGFTEMENSGSSALCCGNSAWTGCDAYSKALQVKRLTEAHETGGDLLVTACPKCQIHLKCAMRDPFRGENLKMDMADIINLLARTICWK